jgi:hypothetical protein
MNETILTVLFRILKLQLNPQFNGQNSSVIPLYYPVYMSIFPRKGLYGLSSVCTSSVVLKLKSYLVYRSFHRKLNLCCAVFGTFCVTNMS